MATVEADSGASRAPEPALQESAARAAALVARARAKMELFDSEGYQEAVPLLREAIETRPGFAPAYAALAETYAYWGFRREVSGQEFMSLYELAGRYAESALKLAPDRAESHRATAVSLRRGPRADSEKRRQEAELARELDPTDPANWCEIWRVGGYRLDDPALVKALELGGRLCGLHIDLGAVYSELGRHEEALLELTRALKINPRNALALFDAAMVLDRSGRRAKARELLARARQLHPSDPLIDNGLDLLGEDDA